MKFTIKLLALFFGMLMLVNVANAESPREQLKQMVEQLQKNPTDDALREKIIALAHGLKPAPALPDEAVRRMARGTEAFKEAKSTADYQAAVKEFQQATLAAPWSGDAYFNLGLSQDKAEDYEGSLRSLKLAQQASPDSKDIKDLYYKVEYQRDKFAEQNSAATKESARRAAEASRQAVIYQGLDGGVWKVPGPGMGSDHITAFIEVHGHRIVRYASDDRNGRGAGWDVTFTSRHFRTEGFGGSTSFDVTISDDGQSITETYPNQYFTYQRIK